MSTSGDTGIADGGSKPGSAGHASIQSGSGNGGVPGWRRTLHRGASGAFAVMVGGALLGFAAHLLVARLVGVAQYGIYALMLSWVSVLAVFAQAGQDTSVVRFLPGYIARGEWNKARGLRLGVGALVLASSIVVAVAGCAVVHALGGRHAADWRATFYIGFAMLPILSQLQQSGALHRAFKRAVASGIYQSVLRPFLLMALLPIVLLMAHRLNAPLAAAASACAALLALVASSWNLGRAWRVNARSVRPQYELGRWTAMGLRLSLLSIVIVVGNRLDVLIVGTLVTADRIGPYYAAVQMAGFSLYGMQAVNVVLAPMIAERFEAGDLAGLQIIARRAARIGFAVAVLAGVFFVLVGHWVLGWFGEGFEIGYLPLIILLLGYVLSSSFGEVGFLLSMTQYQNQASGFVAIGIVINALAAYLLVPRLGIAGAAIGAALAITVWRGLGVYFVRKHLRINPAVFGKPLLAAPSA